MKSPTVPRTPSNWFHAFIHDAINARGKDLAMIGNIMRDDIFHSTLDWQTSEQLSFAAGQAFDLLNENRDLYKFSRANAMAAFNEMCDAEASR
jgi:hypothetical protein